MNGVLRIIKVGTLNPKKRLRAGPMQEAFALGMVPGSVAIVR